MSAMSSFVMKQARERVIRGFAVRADAIRKSGASRERALKIIHGEIVAAHRFAAEVVKGLEAVPFIEDWLTGEITNSACAVSPEMVEPQMKLREGFAGVLRQLNDKRALAQSGAEEIYNEVELVTPENIYKPEGGE